MTSLSEQEKLRNEALLEVKNYALQMKRSLDKKKLMEALKHASNMLSELRTSVLSPKHYYELYMSISDELHHLESHLCEEFSKGEKITDLYELVQYAGNIVPRLYLLITVGLVYIQTKEFSRQAILKDLVEMCRGVQHPLRGLFLRNYLLQCTKNVLPDTKEDSENGGGNVNDAIEFILINFGEMNKLWVRMQHQGHSRELERRERERRELRLLVGTNLVRLSQLESLDIENYKKLVLPGILEQVVSCRDGIAQEYLLECIIQVFPDEFHLQTLETFLKACAEVSLNVNIKNVLGSFMNRLGAFADRQDANEIPSDIHLFDIFSEHIKQLMLNHNELPTSDILSLHTSLINLIFHCYPEQWDFVDKVLESAVEVVQKFNISRVEHQSVDGLELFHLLQLSIRHPGQTLYVLKLVHFKNLLSHFDFNGQRLISLDLITTCLEKNTEISSLEDVDAFLKIISPLICDEGSLTAAAQDPTDFYEDQTLLGRFIHLMHSEDNDIEFQILNCIQKHLIKGGAQRLHYTMPSLIFCALQLARKLNVNHEKDQDWEQKCENVFKFCHQNVLNLAKAEYAELALRIYLQCVLAVSLISLSNAENIAYEFFSQAFVLFEEEISDSRNQMNALILLIGTFEKCSCFTEENHKLLRRQCTLASAKLLKKPDQCRATYLCAYIFWSSTEYSDAKSVLICLQKAGRILNQCMDSYVQAQLLTEVLNMYIYFFEKHCASVTSALLNQLILVIKEHLNNLNITDEALQIKKHFTNTIDYLSAKKETCDSGDIIYKDIEL